MEKCRKVQLREKEARIEADRKAEAAEGVKADQEMDQYKRSQKLWDLNLKDHYKMFWRDSQNWKFNNYTEFYVYLQAYDREHIKLSLIGLQPAFWILIGQTFLHVY